MLKLKKSIFLIGSENTFVAFSFEFLTLFSGIPFADSLIPSFLPLDSCSAESLNPGEVFTKIVMLGAHPHKSGSQGAQALVFFKISRDDSNVQEMFWNADRVDFLSVICSWHFLPKFSNALNKKKLLQWLSEIRGLQRYSLNSSFTIFLKIVIFFYYLKNIAKLLIEWKGMYHMIRKYIVDLGVQKPDSFTYINGLLCVWVWVCLRLG